MRAAAAAVGRLAGRSVTAAMSMTAVPTAARAALSPLAPHVRSIGGIGGGIVYPPSTARIAERAPAFAAEAVVGGEITTLKLADYVGKWVVLFFYPKACIRGWRRCGPGRDALLACCCSCQCRPRAGFHVRLPY